MLFFTDLDNTLIYSHRHKTNGPIVWVEDLNGKPQSYMTAKTYSFFSEQNTLEVVPVTTRREEQYQRLRRLSEGLGWSNALVCNGAILLRGSIEDQSWTAESLQISEPDRPAFQELKKYARQICNADQIIAPNPFMFSFIADDIPIQYANMKLAADPAHITVLRGSRKIYCIPKSLSKGAAIRDI